MLCDRRGFFRRASWVSLLNAATELGAVFRVHSHFTIGPALAHARTSVGISQAFELSSSQRMFFDEDALALVALPCAAKSNDNGAKIGVFRCSTSKGSIPTRNEDKVGEVRARHAKRALAFESEPAAAPELVTALGALGGADDLENYNVRRLTICWHHPMINAAGVALAGESHAIRTATRRTVNEHRTVRAWSLGDTDTILYSLNGRAIGRFCGISTFSPSDRPVIGFGQE